MAQGTRQARSAPDRRRRQGMGFSDMGRFYMILGLAIVVVLMAGFGYLAAFDIPAPRKTYETEIPNDRLPR